MHSLRTRRPSDGTKIQRNPSKLTKFTANRDARQSRVDDRIKKRLSMRYADISAPQPTENIPVVPGLPIGVRPQHAHSRSVGNTELTKEKQKEDARAAENKLLEEKDFDPDAYIKLKLANSTEAELMSLQSHLRTSRDEVASDLQRNVFQNYADFMLVSKEISTLENEMLEFKESLAEWKGMPSLLHIDESSSVADRRRNVRSSIADLRILYANQMQTLHTQIEGSAKYIPTLPGRHIIMEMNGISALNAATFKVDHIVKFVLLDDALLVSRKRRRTNNTESEKLVAERCWMLSEMMVLDTKDTPIVTNVFKIRHGKETHVYRTELVTDKKGLLSQFRYVAEELAAKKRKEREGEHERRKSLWATGDTGSHNLEKLPSMPDWMTELAQKAGAGSGNTDKAESDARWVGDFADELTVAIALREWSEAVTLVEEGEAKLPTIPALKTKLTPLKASLTAALLHSLSSLNNRKTVVVELISLLLRLGAGSAARSTFLAARTEVTRKRVRMIRFEGAAELYINDLAIVIFTGIKHTADWFLASFMDNDAASCFIDWAKAQIEEYALMFRKQVYTSDVEPKTVEDALMITYNQSKKLLEEYGLDFRYHLQSLLVEKVEDPVRQQTGLTDPIVNLAASTLQPWPETPLPAHSHTLRLTIPSVGPNISQISTMNSSEQPSSNQSSPTMPSGTSANLHPSASSSIGTARSPATRNQRLRTPKAVVTVETAASSKATTNITGEPFKISSTSPALRTTALSTPIASSPNVPPPPRSIDRPSSAAGNRTPAVAFPRRHGMI